MAIQLELLKEVEAYWEIGTVEECREAVERMKPKKAIIIEEKFDKDNEVVMVEWKCPVCGLNVIEEPPCQEYCSKCGNKLGFE